MEMGRGQCRVRLNQGGNYRVKYKTNVNVIVSISDESMHV
jgi:hypothetical protein